MNSTRTIPGKRLAAKLARLLPAALFLAAAGAVIAPRAAAEPTAFRMNSIYLRDPHAFVQVLIVCADVTDNGVPGLPSLNQQINAAITADADTNGFLDLNALLIFDPLAQSAPSGELVYHNGLCTAPMTGTSCSLDPANPVLRTAYANQATGTCLAPRPGTTRPYSPAVVSPTGPCFVTGPLTLTLDFGGIPIMLHDGQAAARYTGGDPATGLASGLLMGFLSQADADNIIIPAEYPLIGGRPLSSLLRGGAGSCASGDDRDFGVDGVTRGWWFYLNFTANPVPLTTPTGVVVAGQGDATGGTVPPAAGRAALRFYPAMPNPFAPSTAFAYALSSPGSVRLDIYDASGRRVATLADVGAQSAGQHTVEWDGRDDAGSDLPAGVYFARLSAGGESRTQKLLLQR